MARIIEGDVDTFNALALGDIHPATHQFLMNQMENQSPTLTDYGRKFFESGRSLFERLENSRAMRVVKAARRAVSSIWQLDEIRHLSNIHDIQWAPPKMQRYIMAEPTVRKLYHEQRVEGYDGTYKDAFPEYRGVQHPDYRRVMNGLVVFDEEGDWSSTTYYDNNVDEHDLELSEQVDVVDTWANVKHFIKQGKEDPLSRWGADL